MLTSSSIVLTDNDAEGKIHEKEMLAITIRWNSNKKELMSQLHKCIAEQWTVAMTTYSKVP